MKLQTSTPAGVVYRLRNAVFTVTDATNAVVATLDSESAPADATRLSAAIEIGSYTISLASGWSMERNGQAVDAALSSAVARSFVVQADEATLVTYAFKVEGAPIVLGGTLDLAIEVGECSRDSFEPNDTRETAAPLASVLTAASVCGEDDWFTFELNAEAGTPLAVTLDFVNANGDLDLRLIQPDTTELRSEGITDQERINFASQEGVYFVRVYGFNGAVGDYRLEIIDQ
ncbi:MAG TPA: PPC domain-containing protein [Polyangiaceae bacterium]